MNEAPMRERRFVTWRLPSRQFTKVHVLGQPGLTVCGKAIPRQTGSPQDPIPEFAMCQECARNS